MSAAIKPFGDEFEEYGRDESRTSGEASSISFPTTEDEVRAILETLHAEHVPITVQAPEPALPPVPCPRWPYPQYSPYESLPGPSPPMNEAIFCCAWSRALCFRSFVSSWARSTLPTAGWDQVPLEAYEEFQASPEQFFPTDPTEASACLGGMAACNASGARSYAYGPMRPHVTGLHVALADGDLLELQRGEAFAQGRHLSLVTAEGRTLELDLPGYTMPETKNASGYFVADDMDAIDLFIGACGTLGVITELEIALQAAPSVVWGVSCFFDSEDKAVSFTDSVRPVLSHTAAIEYFDAGALDILRRQREQSTAFASLPALDKEAKVCVYVELDCDDEAQATEELYHLGWVLELAGGRDDATWVARTEVDRECQRFFRHAVPESVNMLIDERRRTDPTITKLGSDMSVPNARLADVVAFYRRTLAESGLESAAWGHIGNNHLHVNILPRDAQDYRRGGELFAQWAAEVTAMGGAVSAEHGVGKIKAGFLETMYGHEAMVESAATQAAARSCRAAGSRQPVFGEALG